eukprot:scaffold152806_cov32-Prasinocladus_malaysianus.AAC.1
MGWCRYERSYGCLFVREPQGSYRHIEARSRSPYLGPPQLSNLKVQPFVRVYSFTCKKYIETRNTSSRESLGTTPYGSRSSRYINKQAAPLGLPPPPRVPATNHHHYGYE